MIEHPSGIVCELSIWKLTQIVFYTGHIDLCLIHDNTFYVSDLKYNEIYAIRNLPQITAYSIMMRDIISSKFELNDDNITKYHTTARGEEVLKRFYTLVQ